MAKLKVSYTRRSGFSGTRQYMQYAECLKNRCNAVDGTFYEAIKNNTTTKTRNVKLFEQFTCLLSSFINFKMFNFHSFLTLNHEPLNVNRSS